MLNIAAPIIGSEEIDAVRAVLDSGMLAQGPKVAELEEAFAAYCGTKYALALNSGTAALHCALFAAGIGPGDEVITTPFSFIASINPIIFMGARPVLVDIEADTFNIDTQKLAAAITPKTKAIIPVHLYGQPVDYEPIKVLAKQYNLMVIEDACQAVGAAYKGIKAGNLGDIGCFSLYATKNIMSGEGGLLTTNNQKFADAVRRFRQHGMGDQYEYVHIGLNYRMSDVHAAIALAQLMKVDEFNELRQRNAKLLNEGLKNVPGIITPHTAANRTHVFHQYTLRITKDFSMSRGQLMEELKKRGIGSGVYYPKPLHAYAHVAKLGYSLGDFPEAEKAADEVLSLPVHPKISPEDVDLMIKTIKELARA